MTDAPRPPSFYERIGGLPTLEAFVERFYAAMDTDPEVARIRAWHGTDLGEMKEKLVAFLSGFVGGPPLYPQRYGAPMMRARHLPFRIGPAERDMWVKCARAALAATIADAEARAAFDTALAAFAEHMRNRDDSGEPAGIACGRTGAAKG